MSEFDTSKLPKYAQDRIRILERTIYELNDKLETLRANTPSQISYSDGLEEPHFLPGDSRLIFTFPDDPKRRLRVYFVRDQVELNSDYGRILVHPQSANTIKITLTKI